MAVLPHGKPCWAELIRKHTHADANIQAIRGQTLLPVQLYASVLPWVAAVLWVGGGHIITRFYPLYSEAVLPMRILLMASYFLVVNAGVTSFLFAIDKHRRNLLILTSALCFNVLADVILLQNGWGPAAVAVGSLITYVLYAVVHLASYLNLTRREWMEF